MTDVERRVGIVRGDQRQGAGQQAVAVLAVQRGLLEAVRQDPYHPPVRSHRPPHRGIIDAFRAAGDYRLACLGGQPPDPFGVLQQVVIDMTRSHDRQPTGAQDRVVPTSIQHRWRQVLESLLEPLWIRGIRSTHHPDRSTVPALHGLAQQKPTIEQPAHPRGIRDRSALLEDIIGLRGQEVRRLVLDLAQSARESIVLLRGQRSL